MNQYIDEILDENRMLKEDLNHWKELAEKYRNDFNSLKIENRKKRRNLI